MIIVRADSSDQASGICSSHSPDETAGKLVHVGKQSKVQPSLFTLMSIQGSVLISG